MKQGDSSDAHHLSQHHMSSGPLFVCNCGREFVWSSELFQHLRSQHIRRFYVCKICGQLQQTYLNAQAHAIQHQDTEKPKG